MLRKIFNKNLIIFFLRCKILLIFFLNPLNVYSLEDKSTNNKDLLNSDLVAKSNENIKPDAYILGPGDLIFLNFEGVPEFSKKYQIMPDGLINLPEIYQFYAEGLTIEQLTKELEKKYEPILIEPIINAYIIDYRPIRVFITGEVNRPGFYTLFVNQSPIPDIKNIVPNYGKPGSLNIGNRKLDLESFSNEEGLKGYIFPTLYDAISLSRGVTPYSDLRNIEVIRKTGDEKIKAKIDFFPLITKGDLSQNIRIFDGDSIKIPKSENIIKDQISLARNSNLNPSQLVVYVTGNVEAPGAVVLPQGSGLNQAIAMAGGAKILSGKVEFLRFRDYGDSEKRKFAFNKSSKKNSYKNPVLIDGDIIYVNKSIAGVTSSVLGEISKPILGGYTLFNIFSDD